MEYFTAILILGLGLFLGQLVTIFKKMDGDSMPDINNV